VKPLWRVLSVVGGIVGAAAGGLAVGVAAQSARVSAQRRNADDPYADGPLGALNPSRVSTVAADDGLPIAAEEVDPDDGGTPELTVVLVHGYMLDRRCWHFQRRDLAAMTGPRVRQVLYDQRSHGRSGRGSTESSTIEQLGRDLDALVRALVPDGPIVLVGHSMGGMTIMALAEQRPELFVERIRGVVLIGTSAGDIGRSGLPRPLLSRHNPTTRGLGMVAEWQPGLVEWARRAGGQITWSAIRALAFGDRKVSPSLVDLMESMIDGTSVQAITDFVRTLGTHSRYAALAGLRHCKVLVISGDTDRLTPFSHSEAMTAELPEAGLVRAEGAGHMVMLEQPELVTGHLIELVTSCISKDDGRRRWKRA
jgi:pimeloyl-ACP methyl ester carboxylesterase